MGDEREQVPGDGGNWNALASTVTYPLHSALDQSLSSPFSPSFGVFPPPSQSWKDGPEPSTPHYSQGILQEGSFKQHLAVLHSWLGRECTGVKQAVVLLKVRNM